MNPDPADGEAVTSRSDLPPKSPEGLTPSEEPTSAGAASPDPQPAASPWASDSPRPVDAPPPTVPGSTSSWPAWAPAAPSSAFHSGSEPSGSSVWAPPPPRRSISGAAIAGVLGVALLSGLTGAAAVTALDGDGGSTVFSAAPVAADPDADAEPLAQVAAAVTPSVVSISAASAAGSGTGSGIVIGSDGTVLTNNHVVALAAEAGEISINLSDGRTAPATVVGRDPATDLAVIRARGLSGLTPITWGSSDDLAVGDTVLAVGSPLGLDGSVTSGIVSARDRSVNLQSEGSTPAVVPNAIQTDAAINPGNSGGALVNTSGQVVGINTAIASLASGGLGGQSGSIGLGFAIPSEEAQGVAEALIAGRTPTYPVLGVQVGNSPRGGALIGQVTPDGAASAAGLEVGDVVVDFGGEGIASAEDLTAAVRGRDSGDVVTLTVVRNGSEQEIDVTLGTSS